MKNNILKLLFVLLVTFNTVNADPIDSVKTNLDVQIREVALDIRSQKNNGNHLLVASSSYIKERVRNGGVNFINLESQAAVETEKKLSDFNQSGKINYYVFVASIYLSFEEVTISKVDFAELKDEFYSNKPSGFGKRFKKDVVKEGTKVHNHIINKIKKENKINFNGEKSIVQYVIHTFTPMKIGEDLYYNPQIHYGLEVTGLDDTAQNALLSGMTDFLDRHPNGNAQNLLKSVEKTIEIVDSGFKNFDRQYLANVFENDIAAFKSEFENDPTKLRLIEEIKAELDRMTPVIDENYGRVRLEELSTIDKLLYIESKKITEGNLLKQLNLLKRINDGIIDVNKELDEVEATDYKKLRRRSRLINPRYLKGLSIANREKLLVAWGEAEGLTENGWLGYDETKVIELITQISVDQQSVNAVIDLFKKNDCALLLKFYSDLDDFGGTDNNTLFVEKIVTLVNIKLGYILQNKSNEEKWAKLVEMAANKELLLLPVAHEKYDMSSVGIKNFTHKSTGDNSYRLTSGYCRETGPPPYKDSPKLTCNDWVSFGSGELGLLDFVVLFEVHEVEAFDPENFIQSTFQIRVKPGISYKWESKEDMVEIAGTTLSVALTAASFAVPAVALLRAVQLRNVTQIIISSSELGLALLGEVASSQSFNRFMDLNYKDEKAAVMGVLTALDVVTGNLSSSVDDLSKLGKYGNSVDVNKLIVNGDFDLYSSVVADISKKRAAGITEGMTNEEFQTLVLGQNFIEREYKKIGRKVQKVEVANPFAQYKNFENLSESTLDYLKKSNWNEDVLDAFNKDLDELLKNPDFVAKLDAGLVDSWKILFKDGDAASELVRRNPENLEKLSKFISETGMEESKLISSFGNAKNPQKWIDMKIPESELDAVYDGFKNSPPAKFEAWTPEHKAQRWQNHKAGIPDAEYKNWSNQYDGNIDKAIAANKGVDDYASTLSGNVVREKSFTNISINTSDGVQTFTRRLDIVDEDAFKGIEFKEYSSGKVYRSPDIRREYALDGKLLQDDLLDEIEWIFKGCEPSAPLRTDLEALGIKITLLP